MTNQHREGRRRGRDLSAADRPEPETPWVVGLTALAGLAFWLSGVFDGLPAGSEALLGVIGGGLCAGVLRPAVRLALGIARKRALDRAYARRCGRRG